MGRTTQHLAVDVINAIDKRPTNSAEGRRNHQENPQDQHHHTGHQEQTKPKVQDGKDFLVDHVHWQNTQYGFGGLSSCRTPVFVITVSCDGKHRLV